MADLSALTAAITQAAIDVTAAADRVTAAEAGQVQQSDIDTLTTQVQAISTSADAIAPATPAT